MLRKLFYTLIIICLGFTLWSCSDEEYTTSSAYSLSFSSDTIRLDTLFSTVPSTARSFWVYNKGDKALRCQSVRLERGNQSGFRVNVDGVYLGASTGYQTNEVELLAGDSVRVFVEVTTGTNGQTEPKMLEDNIVFILESGLQQKVNLSAYSWDAEIFRHKIIDKDTVLTAGKPIVIYDSLVVAENATLTLEEGATLYFNGSACLDVYGKLVAKGTAENNVTLRGDRLDNMFDYLPYDFVSGQWGGVHFYPSSYGNKLEYTDIHSTFDGIVVDSCDVEKQKLDMLACTVHNCQGYGIKNTCSWIQMYNCQVSNTLRDCVFTDGGVTVMNNCTLAQFYPFDAERGVALRFSSAVAPMQFICYNTLVTGYADDVIMGEQGKEENTFYYEFHNCILRTPKVENDEQFVNVTFEDPKDTVATARKHFVKIDTDNLRYDFRLDSISPAIGAADVETAMPYDRMGLRRDDKPDIGAFEWIKADDNEK